MSAWPKGVSAMSPLALAAAADNYNRAEPIDAQQLGAIGNAVQASDGSWSGTDNSSVFNTLFSQSADATNDGLYIPPGTYLLKSGIFPSIVNLSNIRVRGAGANRTKFIIQKDDHVIRIVGTTDQDSAVAVYLTAPATQPTRTLTVNDTSTLTKDQWITIKDNSQPVTDNDTGRPTQALLGEINRIQSIDSATQITLYGYLEFSYTSNATPALSTIIRRWTAPAQDIDIADLSFQWDTSLSYTNTNRLFEFQRAIGVNLSRIRMIDSAFDTYTFTDVLDLTVDQCEDRGLLGANHYSLKLSNGTSRFRIYGYRSRNCRHAFTTTNSTTSIETAHGLVHHCIGQHTDLTCFDTHTGSRDITFDNCIAIGGGDATTDAGHGVGAGFQMRGRRQTNINPRVYGYYTGISVAFGDRCRVIRGEIEGCQFGAVVNRVPYFELDGTIFRNISDTAVSISSMVDTVDGSALPGLRLVGRVEGNPSTAVVNLVAGVPANDWVIDMEAPDATTRFAGAVADRMTPRFPTGNLPARVSTDGNDSTPVVTETYIAEVLITEKVIANGLSFFNGSAVSGNIKGYLADYRGTVVASTASTAQAGIDSYQRLPLTSVYLARAGIYYACLQFDNVVGRFNAHAFGDFGASKKTSTVYGTLTSITVPTTFTANLGPIATVY